MEMTEKLQSKVVWVQQFSFSAHLQVLQRADGEINQKAITGNLKVTQA